ncbi:MAG: ABC transporter ATP-binding protein [Lachnospiraceae bacterium]|nr:ABC transporter ATP-binding protein [Lachnospiraceae bacterium]
MRSFFDIVRKLNYIMTARQKRMYVLVAFIAFIGSLCELIGVAAALPFFESVMTPEGMESKWYTALIVKIMGTDERFVIMRVTGLSIIAVYLIKNLYLMFSSYVQAWYSTGVQRDLSIRLTRALLNSSYTYHLNVNSSILIRSISQDVVGVFGIFFYLFRVFAELFTIGAISIYIISLDPLLAVSLVGILGSCMMILIFGLKKLVRYFGKIGQECDGKMLQYLSQAFNGIKEIMVKKREDYFADSFSEACSLSAKAAKRNNFLNVIPVNIYEFVCVGGLLGVVMFRLQFVNDIGVYMTKLATVALAAFRLFPAVGRLTTNLNAIIYNRPRLDTIYEMIKETENGEHSDKNTEAAESGDDLQEWRDALEVKNISWHYPSRNENVLENLSITVNKGESVALIGPSGAGKTTLADVILGLLKPQKGTVSLDGVDVYEHTRSWAKVIGYVPQAVYLTDDTIRANIAFGIYPKDINDEKIWKVLEEAQLADYVRSLEKGLDTMVGERGVRLSGGQRQRIAIARALYDDPQILVLDEATSALDNDTETAVMEAIDSLHGSKTMIIVAHRLSTIRNCDKIYEIKNGKAILRDKEEVLKES